MIVCLQLENLAFGSPRQNELLSAIKKRKKKISNEMGMLSARGKVRGKGALSPIAPRVVEECMGNEWKQQLEQAQHWIDEAILQAKDANEDVALELLGSALQVMHHTAPLLLCAACEVTRGAGELQPGCESS